MTRQQKLPVPTTQTILDSVRTIATRFAQQRSERQRRRQLDQGDFDALRDSGYLLMAVPRTHGGVWQSIEESTRAIAETLRTLAHGDSSVALVAAMHPAVIMSGGWLTEPQAPPELDEAWQKQRDWVFQTCHDGHWWGTIISEPGSGGDVSKTRSATRFDPSTGQYLVSGQKHFGSGSGITSFMITRAIPDGETKPDSFVLDMRDVPWNGTSGVELTAAWDGQGMTATQSHALNFQDFPAIRSAWPKDNLSFGGFGSCLFTAVIVGIVETAVETARNHLEPRRNSMRAYEQVEWSHIEIEAWLIRQAYEGALRAAEGHEDMRRGALLGKEAVAGLAESLMLRISKVIGGSAYSRHTPYGFWLEDVRALGFLRPPWGLAFDTIFETSWKPDA